MLLLFLAASVSFAAASPIDRLETPDASTPEPPALALMSDLTGDGDSLNNMFKEVENLIKDSAAKLNYAAREMESEENAADRVSFKDLPPNYHNQTVKETKVGNNTIITKQEIFKKTNNETGETFVSKTIVSSLQSGDKTAHECIVDEDCGLSGYCNLADFNYRCHPCKEREPCTRDGECCDGQLCIWGQCDKSEKGESGAICERQNDCIPGLCCAVHSSLLFPVCTPLLVKGEECQKPNFLLDIFSWDVESEAPLNKCPCGTGLICQGQRDGSALTCEELTLDSKREDSMRPPLFTTVPQEEEVVYEDGIILPTGIGADLSEDEIIDDGRQIVDFI